MIHKGKSLLALLLALCMMLPLLAQAEEANEAVYKRGLELQAAGEHDSAISIFKLLGDYKDSAARIEESLRAKDELVYQTALTYLADGQHDAAIAVLSLIPDHRDAKAKIEEARAGKLQLQYDRAAELARQGSYEEAKAIFLSLKDFSDSQAQAGLMDKGLKRDALMHEARALKTDDAAGAYEHLQALLQDPEGLLRPQDRGELQQMAAGLRQAAMEQLLDRDADQAAAFLLALDEQDAVDILSSLTNPQAAYALVQQAQKDKPEWAAVDALEPGLLEALTREALARGEAEQALARLQRLKDLAVDAAQLKPLYDKAWDLQLRAAFGEGLQLLYVDLDGDEVEDALGYDQEKLAAYWLMAAGIEAMHEALPMQLHQLKVEKGPLGGLYLIGQSPSQETVVLGRDADGFFELLRRDQVDSLKLTETGLHLHRVFTREPLRFMDEEFVVKGREVVALPAQASADLAQYPDTTAALQLLRAYDEALDYAIPQELAYLRMPEEGLKALEAFVSLQQLDEWLLASGEKLDDAQVYDYQREVKLHHLRLQRGNESIELVLHQAEPRDPGSLRIAGALSGPIPYPQEIAHEVEVPAYAYTQDRTERDKAQAHPLNTWMQSTLDDSRREDWYLLTLPQNGGIRLSMEHAFLDSDYTLFSISLYRKGSKDPVWEGNSKGNVPEAGWYMFFLGAGTYELRVRNDRNFDGEHAYRLVPNFVVQKAEVEDNNNLNQAQPITLGERWRGQLYGSGDQDWFRVELPSPGSITLTVDHQYIDSDSFHYKLAWLLDKDTAIYEHRSRGQEEESSSYTFFAPAGVSYLRMTSDDRHSYAPYGFTVHYEPQDNVEQESNGRIDRANPIELNQDYQGSLSIRDDVDFYAFTLLKPGRIILNFKFPIIDSQDYYFLIRFYDEMKRESEITSLKLRGNEADFERHPFYLPQGTYYMSVETENRRTANPYTLRLNYEERDNCELERNDSFTAANPLTPGQVMIGSLITNNDVDSYKLTISEPSKVDFVFSFEVIDQDRDYFKLSFHNAAFDEIWEIRQNGRRGGFSSWHFYLMPGDYYFRVSAAHYAMAPYNLTVNVEPCADCEQEPNNSMHTATPLKMGQWLYGSLINRDDHDYYLIQLDQPARVRIHFNHPHIDHNEDYFEFSLYQADEQRIARFRSKGTEPTLSTNDSFDLPAGTYYLRVTGANGHWLNPYQISFGP